MRDSHVWLTRTQSSYETTRQLSPVGYSGQRPAGRDRSPSPTRRNGRRSPPGSTSGSRVPLRWNPEAFKARVYIIKKKYPNRHANSIDTVRGDCHFRIAFPVQSNPRRRDPHLKALTSAQQTGEVTRAFAGLIYSEIDWIAFTMTSQRAPTDVPAFPTGNAFGCTASVRSAKKECRLSKRGSNNTPYEIIGAEFRPTQLRRSSCRRRTFVGFELPPVHFRESLSMFKSRNGRALMIERIDGTSTAVDSGHFSQGGEAGGGLSFQAPRRKRICVKYCKRTEIYT